MKRALLQIIVLACVAVVAGACTGQFSDAAKAEKVEMLGIAILPEMKNPDREVPELKVTLTNPAENYTVKGTIENGQLTVVNNVIPGIYNITLAGSSDEGIFAGGINGIDLFTHRGEDNPVKVPVSVSGSGELCFKEIFYNSSTSYYKKDQYYEIYNNSDYVYYLDNLCIATLQPDQSSYESEFMTWNEPDADEYVYATIIWRIKGTGKQYPLQPGQSVVIASTALNHPVVNVGGGQTVDLTSAEFEAWIPSMSGEVSDNPKSINMELYMGTSGNIGRYWFTTVYGCCYALFKSEEAVKPSDLAIPIGQTRNYYRIKMDRCIDVVEAVKNQKTQEHKRVPNSLDAGSIYIDNIYTSTSIVRKIDQTKTAAKGRIVLQDHNNTSEDFEKMTPPVLRRNLDWSKCIPEWSAQSGSRP